MPHAVTPPPADKIPRQRSPREGVEKFFETFNRIRSRPTWRQGDRPSPVLFISGPDDAIAEARKAIRRQCQGTPYADVPVRGQWPAGVAYKTLAAQLRAVSRQLAAEAPRGEARLRFPLLNQVLWLLDVSNPEDENAYKHEVRERKRQLSPNPGEGWSDFGAMCARTPNRFCRPG